METRKTDNHDESEVSRFSGSNVYEVAVASAQEAKRINHKFYVAKKKPPDNLVITAIRKVVGGEVGYTVEGEGDGYEPHGNVNGHS